MAVTLPDFTALGRRPVPMGNRGFARQDTTAPGQAMEGLGQVVGKIGEEFAQRDDEQKVLEYRRKLIEWDKTNVHDPETGAAGKKGRDAFDLPKTLTQDFDKFAAEAASGLSSNRQRKIAQEIALGRREQIGTWAAGHALREREVFDAGEFKANISAAKDNAVLYPTLADQELARMAETTRRYLGSRVGPEALAATIKGDASEVHTRIIHGLVSDGNVDSAQDYFKKNAANMTAPNKESAQTVLREVGTRAKVQAFEDDARARGLSAEDALKDARARFVGDPMTRDAAVARVHAMDAERATLETRATKQVTTDAWSALMAKNSMAAIPPSTMALLRVKAPEEERQMRDWLEAKWRRAKSDADGKKFEETPEQLREYLGMLDMAVERPADFAGMSVEAFARLEPTMTKEHFSSLTRMRVGINKDEAKVVQVGKLAKGAIGEVRQVIAGQEIKLTGAKRTDAQIARAEKLEAAIYDAILTASNEGPVDAKKARELAIGQLKIEYEQGSAPWWKLGLGSETAVPVFEKDPGKVYIRVKYEDIPPAIRAEISADLKPEKRTRDEVERTYQRAVDAGMFK